MPTYDLRCPACGHRFSTFAGMKQRDSIGCPCCCAPKVEQDFTELRTLRIGVREFAGFDGESRIHQFLPNEIREMRRELGAAGNCIGDDGSVRYANKAEAERFNKTYADWVDREKRRKCENRERLAPKVAEARHLLAERVKKGDATEKERRLRADTVPVNGPGRRRKKQRRRLS